MAKDPYKYFRIEGREILEGLTQGVLDLEKAEAPKEVLARLLRLAHTLKGASRVVKQPEIAEHAHAIEDLLVPYREAEAPVPRECTTAVFRLIDGVTAALAHLDAPAAPATGAAPIAVVASPAASVAPPALAKEPSVSAPVPAAASVAPGRMEDRLQIAETVRVEIADMDSVLASLAEASVQVGALRQASSVLDHVQRLTRTLVEQLRGRSALRAASVPVDTIPERVRDTVDELAASLGKNHRHLVEGIDRAERELWQVRDKVSQLRLLPAHTIFAPLSRAARDAAHLLGKSIEFETRGGETRLEAHVLSAVRNALMHVVRNAVAHGIESEAERLAAGKPALGRIELEVERNGHRVAFICRDDGRGIDVDGVRRVAIERGLISPADAHALSVEEATRLIFRGGVSTAGAVDEVSGRGVGLDVVHEVASEFKGEAAARSQVGRGTTVELRLPISLSALMALAVEAGGLKVWFPLDAVAGTLRLSHKEVIHAAMEDAILHEGRAIPFRPLASIVGPGDPSRHAWSTVIVRVDGKWAAIGADRLLEVATIVVRPIPAMAGSFPMLAGATFDPEGNPQLVLDPHGLTEAVSRRGEGVAEMSPAERLPVLVIDDSLTTRMLEQAILESAGYEVDLAVSAEDGLQKAAQRRYGLFLCDVEMPGLNGFEFVARTKADPALRETPTILVTSLSSPADRRRGVEVGAYGYIVKGDFDEERLRQLIRSVVG